MPGIYKDEAVVLKTIKLGEADRIVTLMTRQNGKVRAVVKGVRKTKSRFGARLEPFTRVDLMLYRGRKDLDTITSADIITSFDGLRKDYMKVTSAAALADIVDKITPDRERAFSTYALLIGGLEALADDKGGTVVPAFLVKLLSVCGYHPELTACAGCGASGLLGGFSPALGGVLCEDCYEEDEAAMRMPPERIALLSRLLSSEFGEPASEPEAEALTAALRRYAEFHLERPLRSLHLLAAPS
ncbi:MAG: repair protein RecO [Actinomycetota bacterium]|jgi:DNA repair protein RecO (recombination protein O)|nr:repair protein RecO [Actinomycetota bacterium]